MNTIMGMIQASIKTISVPIHPAGWPFIIIFAVVSIVLAILSEALGFVGLVLTLWCVYFFRDPIRTVPMREGLIISPADGVVQSITKETLPPELETDDKDDPLFKAKTLTRVSVFLNVFNVHVNRVPAEGEITQVVYHPGKFFNASLDKASIHNERTAVSMKLKGYKSSIAFVQIAGLIARRIICDLKAGQSVKTGEKYGIIRFGSRADIYLPPHVMPQVVVGQTMIGGETVIADFKSREKSREGTPV